MEKYDIREDSGGTIRYYKPGTYILHRTDGPAVEYTDGAKSWYVNGRRHRTDGPAVEYADGTKFWYVDGKHHRLDGPAIEWADGDNSWYIDDIELTEKRFKEKTSLKEDTAKGEYDIQEDSYGTIQYYKPGTQILHRTDGGRC